MNELIFFFHIFSLLTLTFIATSLGSLGLTSWICLQAILANFFVLKEISLFGLNVTCTDVFAISCALSLNLLQEFHGKQLAKKAATVCLCLLLFTSVCSVLHLLYIPSSTDSYHPVYAKILNQTPRILIASFLAFWVSQKIDLTLFGALKERFPKTPLFYRSTISLLVVELVDTCTFSFLGLYGIVSSVKEILLMSICIKLITVFSMTPFLNLFQKWQRS